MSRSTFAAATAAVLILASPLAQADDKHDKDDDKRYDPTYSAIRIASVKADFSNIDRAFNLGFTLGVRIPGLTWQGTEFISAEIDISSTIIPGENSGGASVLGGSCNNGGGNDGGNDDGGGLGGLGDVLGGGEDGGSDGDGCASSRDGDDLRMNAVGIFAKVRSPGKFFGLARVGYRFVESTIDELEENRSGSAWTLGGGYQYSDGGGAVELSFSQYGADISFIELVVSY